MGEVSLQPVTLDFGTILVGSTAKKTITLLNANDCAIPYYLILTQQINRGSLTLLTSKELSFVKDHYGILPSRSNKMLTLLYSPLERVAHNIVIFCIVLQEFPEEGLHTIDPTSFLSLYSLDQLRYFANCEITGVGAYPLLNIMDIQSIGTPKCSSWNQFSITSINQELITIPNSSEKECAESSSFRDTVKTLKRYLFDFGVKVQGSGATEVHLLFQNLGEIVAELQFQFSTDAKVCAIKVCLPYTFKVNVEKWAESAIPKSDEEKKELAIFYNSLFNISTKVCLLLHKPNFYLPCVRTTRELNYNQINLLPFLSLTNTLI